MVNLQNNPVACHYISQSPVVCQQVQGCMSNLRNSSVALSNLGVKGHYFCNLNFCINGMGIDDPILTLRLSILNVPYVC